MKQLYVNELLERDFGETECLELRGWLRTRRRHNSTIFLDVADSTGYIQVVVEKCKVGDAMFRVAHDVTPESAVMVKGTRVPSRRGNPAWDLVACHVEVIGAATIDVSPHPRSDIDIFDRKLQEQFLENRHFYLRNPKFIAILKFRHLLMRVVHNWFDEQGFTEIHAPILTPTPLYDDKTPIGLTVHDQHVYLTQCVGFYLEQAVHAFEKIYNIGPSFRAEESRSKRHLMEYWHIKAELAFVDFEDLAATVERFISQVSRQCAEKGAVLAKIIGTEFCLDGLQVPFPRIDYVEAVNWLRGQGCDIEVGKSLGSTEEAHLSARFGATPFWVVGIPRSIEPFPYVIDGRNPTRTMTADLIASNGFGELLGIAEKIPTLPMLDERLLEKGKGGDARYEWLRELRQFGCVPHGGFGMGTERLIRWLLNIPHVRDTIPFPRTFRRRIHP